MKTEDRIIDNYWEIANELKTAVKFGFTGEPEFGISRNECKRTLKELGFKCSDAKFDVLVVCEGVGRWSGGGIGKKLQLAIDKKNAGEKVFILSEIDFLKHFDFHSTAIDEFIRAFDMDVQFVDDKSPMQSDNPL